MSYYYNEELFELSRDGNERLEELIKDVKDINQLNKWKENCLFYACIMGYKDMVEILIENGIEIQKDKIYKSKYIDE